MNIALFGGTFDPVHRGHLEVARAAQKRFSLKKILFVPATIPPHKRGARITPYHHRFAMLELALRNEKSFVSSLLEAPESPAGKAQDIHYSIDTIRRFKRGMARADRLFFIVGVDNFLDIRTWREPEALLQEAEFIVVSRPGFSMAGVAGALPDRLRPASDVLRVFRKQKVTGPLVLPGATLHLLDGVNVDLSATAVRRAAAGKHSLAKLVGPEVAAYIKKMHLYKRVSHRPARKTKAVAAGRKRRRS